MKQAFRWSFFIFIGILLSIVVWAQDASLGLADDIVGYLGWQRANAQKSFEQTMHPIAKDIYLNDAAASTVSTKSFPHAEGSIIVKETTDPASMQVKVITAMRKVSGFNPDGGNWQYGMFERAEDGSFMGGWMDVAGAAMCIGCHQGAAQQDFTFMSYVSQ